MKTKTQISFTVTAKLISAFVFATRIVQSLFFLNPKFQGSVLSPLLFITVLEALSRGFPTGCPWELLYADDLIISAGSKEELLVKVKTWKTEMEKKGLRVNMGKTKIMESGINLDVLKKSVKVPLWCLSDRCW